jgi:hypothetical protein
MAVGPVPAKFPGAKFALIRHEKNRDDLRLGTAPLRTAGRGLLIVAMVLGADPNPTNHHVDVPSSQSVPTGHLGKSGTEPASLTNLVNRCETGEGRFTLPYWLPESTSAVESSAERFHLSGGLTSGLSNPLVRAANAA